MRFDFCRSNSTRPLAPDEFSDGPVPPVSEEQRFSQRACIEISPGALATVAKPDVDHLTAEQALIDLLELVEVRKCFFGIRHSEELSVHESIRFASRDSGGIVFVGQPKQLSVDTSRTKKFNGRRALKFRVPLALALQGAV